MKLNNGHLMPQIGLGVFKAVPETCLSICKQALSIGYRKIDTAAVYNNEEAVGRAVRDSEILRSEVFVTSKFILRDNDGKKLFGRKDATIQDITRFKIDSCLEKLNIGYLDLLLLHAPFKKRLEAWDVMESYVESGKIKSIGVSNFGVHHIGNLYQLIRPRGIDETLQDQSSCQPNRNPSIPATTRYSFCL
jgi:diketogulonate reductase-like aldo/keto reductase